MKNATQTSVAYLEASIIPNCPKGTIITFRFKTKWPFWTIHTYAACVEQTTYDSVIVNWILPKLDNSLFVLFFLKFFVGKKNLER